MIKKIGWCAAAVMAMIMGARAAIVYDSTLANETALAHDSTYTLDLQQVGVNNMSAQAVYSSATVAGVLFDSGSQATGSVTVLDYASLSSAAASNHLTVASTSGLTGATLTLPGFVLMEGVDWRVQSTASGTAESIRLALNTIPLLVSSRSGAVVYSTTTAGSVNNSKQMVSSVPSALTVASPLFSGGMDNASITINGVTLLQGRDFTAATSNAATASSLASAINAASLLNTKLSAQALGAVVTSTSTKSGAAFNYGLVSSTPTALSVSGASLAGGTTPAATLGSAIIRIPNHHLTMALPVLYQTAGANFGGLIDQTTYYPIIVDANNVKLASSKANALLGTGIVITSSATSTTAASFSLTPLGISGTPSFKWEVSNNGSDWSDAAVSSVTLSSYSNPPASTLFLFGSLSTRYLRLNAVAPTTGGILLNVTVVGAN